MAVTVFSQQKESSVTLKNGTVINGVIKSLDPTKSLVLIVAGYETTIDMSDVAKIEEVKRDVVNIEDKDDEDEKKDKIIVTDNAPYPETYDLKVGSHTIKMILVRGGDMNMGYDGRHSLSYKSEPVHKVKVTSFYMSKEYIPSAVAAEVLQKKVGKKKQYYTEESFKKFETLVSAIANNTNLPVRMPTEAEWEYAANSGVQSVIFNDPFEYEFCSDFWGKYKDSEYEIDPTGPLKGNLHVVRSFMNKNRRKFWNPHIEVNKRSRLVIKAKDVINR